MTRRRPIRRAAPARGGSTSTSTKPPLALPPVDPLCLLGWPLQGRSARSVLVLPGAPATVPGHGGLAWGFFAGLGAGAVVGCGVPGTAGTAVGRGVGCGVGRRTTGVAFGVGCGVGALDGGLTGPLGAVGVGLAGGEASVGVVGVGDGPTATTTSVGDGSALALETGDGSALEFGDVAGEPGTPDVPGVVVPPEPGVEVVADGVVIGPETAGVEGEGLRSTPATPLFGWLGPPIPTARANDANTRLRTPRATTRRAR
jgi:hypothetical protein